MAKIQLGLAQSAGGATVLMTIIVRLKEWPLAEQEFPQLQEAIAESLKAKPEDITILGALELKDDGNDNDSPAGIKKD